jgi:hypothetical protein
MLTSNVTVLAFLAGRIDVLLFRRANPLPNPLSIVIRERYLTRFLSEGADHRPFGSVWTICGRPVDPQVALQQLHGLTASMRTPIPASMTMELSNTFAYRSMCLPDVLNTTARKSSVDFGAYSSGGLRNWESDSFKSDPCSQPSAMRHPTTQDVPPFSLDTNAQRSRPLFQRKSQHNEENHNGNQNQPHDATLPTPESMRVPAGFHESASTNQ